MIVILWILSFLVSIAPMFGWKDPEWDKRLENYECLVSQDVGYQIFATASSFYVPLLAILFLYWRIFLVARKRIRRRQQVNILSTFFYLYFFLFFYFTLLAISRAYVYFFQYPKKIFYSFFSVEVLFSQELLNMRTIIRMTIRKNYFSSILAVFYFKKRTICWLWF